MKTALRISCFKDFLAQRRKERITEVIFSTKAFKERGSR
jgi:hypothetical protein